jgi:ubiquinol-cytochrome c reductase cytochrome c subunit
VRSRGGRAVAAALAVAGALGLAAPAVSQDEAIRKGRQIYVRSCISCHGPEGEGVADFGPPVGATGIRGAGPSLRGVGAAAADLYLTTGYMPLGEPDQAPARKKSPFTRDQIDALVAYIESLGPGPPIPDVRPGAGNLREGMLAFTEYCAGCHQIVGEGGLVVGGVAPALGSATPTQIGEAIRIGPYLMPRFGRELIDDRTVNSIARYIEFASNPPDEGGWGIGHIGPITEGLVAWLLAGGVLVLVARLIGRTS